MSCQRRVTYRRDGLGRHLGASDGFYPIHVEASIGRAEGDGIVLIGALGESYSKDFLELKSKDRHESAGLGFIALR